MRYLPPTHSDYHDLKAEEGAAANHMFYLRGEGKSGLDLRRYLGGQGFLPNYAFPGRAARVEFRTEDFDRLERPPLVALSELAPGNSLYYRGQQFQITRANISEADATRSAKRCPNCKRVTLLQEGGSLDSCPACGEGLSGAPASIVAVKLPTMQAEPRTRITSNVEERQRRGFQVSSDYRPYRTETHQSTLRAGEVHLTYEHNGTITTVNAGPRTLLEGEDGPLDGFAFCPRCKRWLFSDTMIGEHVHNEGGKGGCPQGALLTDIKRNLSLYVEQQSDVITLDVPKPEDLPDERVEAFYLSLLWALERGALLTLELESGELNGFLLKQTSMLIPFRIVLHETSEGGLGALSSLTEEISFKHLVERTLQLLHHGQEDGCERACYECLLSYENQWYHGVLDRKLVVSTLEELSTSTWERVSSDDHYNRLCEASASSLERRFLEELKDRDIPLPDRAQFPFEVSTGVHTVADFYYRPNLYVYVDGPHHDTPEQRAKDETIRTSMLLYGLEPFVLHHKDDWKAKLESLRARVSSRAPATTPPPGAWDEIFDLVAAVDERWLNFVVELSRCELPPPEPDNVFRDLLEGGRVSGETAILVWGAGKREIALVEEGIPKAEYEVQLLAVSPESNASDIAKVADTVKTHLMS